MAALSLQAELRDHEPQFLKTSTSHAFKLGNFQVRRHSQTCVTNVPKQSSTNPCEWHYSVIYSVIYTQSFSKRFPLQTHVTGITPRTLMPSCLYLGCVRKNSDNSRSNLQTVYARSEPACAVTLQHSYQLFARSNACAVTLQHSYQLFARSNACAVTLQVRKLRNRNVSDKGRYSLSKLCTKYL